MRPKSIDSCFQRRIVPIVWDPRSHGGALAHASAVILQGGSIAELPRVLDRFSEPPLERASLFVHIDLLAGLECNSAGLEFLASFRRLAGIVTAHQQLVYPARRLGLFSILRLFLVDSRSLDRGLAAVAKAKPDAVEIMPATAAPTVARDLQSYPVPRIAGGLCRTQEDARASLASGCRAVTSSHSPLWGVNEAVEFQERP